MKKALIKEIREELNKEIYEKARLKTAELLKNFAEGKENFLPLLAYKANIAGLTLEDFNTYLVADSTPEERGENEQKIEEIFSGKVSSGF